MPAKVVTHIRVAKKSDVTLLNFDFIIAFPPVKIENTPYLYDVPLWIFSYDKIYLPKNKCGFFVNFSFYHTPPVRSYCAIPPLEIDIYFEIVIFK